MELQNLTKEANKLLEDMFPQKETTPEQADVIEELQPSVDAKERRKVLTFVDLYFHDHGGKYPKIKDIAYQTSLSEERVTEIIDGAAGALEARGLPEFDTQQVLDPDFVAICNMMVDPTDQRPSAAKLKMMKKSTVWWRNMLRRPDCREYYQKRIDEVFSEDMLHASKASLARLIERDDLNAIKYTHELTGTFNPAQNQVVVLSAIIQVLMEILARHVPSGTLAVIADEIENSGILPQLGAKHE